MFEFYNRQISRFHAFEGSQLFSKNNKNYFSHLHSGDGFFNLHFLPPVPIIRALATLLYLSKIKVRGIYFTNFIKFQKNPKGRPP